MRNFLFILFISLFTHQTLALDCTKPLSEMDHLICSDGGLNYQNKQYNELLSSSVGKEYKEQLKQLEVARTQCASLYEMMPEQAEVRCVTTGVDCNNHKVEKQEYQKGCLITWYKSMLKFLEMENPERNYFTLPDRASYLKFAKAIFKITGKPYDIEIEEKYQEDEVEHINHYAEYRYYGLYFPKTGEALFKIIKGEFFGHGQAHGTGGGSEQFAVLDEGRVNKYSPIPTNTSSCSIPFDEPKSIKGKIYIPENISFEEDFNWKINKFSTALSTAATGEYKADCLLRFIAIDGSDSLLGFSKDNLEPYNPVTEYSYNTQCIMNYLDKVADLKSVYKENSYDPIIYELLLVNEQKFIAIKDSIIDSCRKTLAK